MSILLESGIFPFCFGLTIPVDNFDPNVNDELFESLEVEVVAVAVDEAAVVIVDVVVPKLNAKFDDLESLPTPSLPLLNDEKP